jgi:hypothetical protein
MVGANGVFTDCDSNAADTTDGLGQRVQTATARERAVGISNSDRRIGSGARDEMRAGPASVGLGQRVSARRGYPADPCGRSIGQPQPVLKPQLEHV